MKKAYDLVCLLMAKETPSCNLEESLKISAVLPSTERVRTALAQKQLGLVYRTVANMPSMTQKEQELELSVCSLRLFFAMEMEEVQRCNRCGNISDEVTVAVGSDIFTCCRTCADKIGEFIMGG